MNPKKLINSVKKVVAVALPVLCVACNSADLTSSGSSDDSSSGSSTTVSSEAFPSALAVSSPLELTDADTETSTSSSAQFLTSASASSSATSTTHYAWATGKIDLILAGTTPSICTFDPELFLTPDNDAECFGPSVDYEDHPDATGSESPDGQLPTGDVGLWAETDDVTGNACAAAQLNARMEGVTDRSLASLMTLASMVCTINSNSLSLPDSSTPTVDILTEMNALGVTDTTFSKAEINYDSTTGGYSYEVDLNYAPGSDSYDIEVDMEHVAGSTSGAYDGVISFLVTDTFTGGNCPSSDVTHNGSMEYSRVSSTDMALEVRAGMFCEHGSDGRDADGIVDASDKYDASSNTTGWGNNFSIFTANYDPSNLDGDYAYSWQAGPQDDNARVFNVNIAGSGTDGLAFYGYGDDIEDTDGSIDGFICNWAGPSSDHTIIEFAQYQELSVDTTTGLINADLSNIEYAPVNDCEYDGSTDFVFDTNLDGDLSDEDSTLTVANDLLEGDDLDSDGTESIEEVIEDSGFAVPSM